MLIEFKVANYRSIREEQKLSLVAETGAKELPECVYGQQLRGLSGLRYLKGAAIYGPNASGKSNLLEAMATLNHFVCNSATTLGPGTATGAVPFKLDSSSANKASIFEVMFVAEGVRYNYSVEMTSKRVTSECLLAFPKGLPQTYFRRVFNAEKKEYRWRTGSQFEAPKDLRSKTRENSLFLSVGPQFNHPKLTPVYEWFRKSCHFLKLNEPESLSGEFTARMLKYGGDSRRTRVLNMLRRADLGVDDVVVKESKMSLDEIKEVLPPAEYRRLQNVEGDIVTAQPSLRHTGDGIDPVLFNFDAEESDGTKRLFALIGPWLDILEKGYTVFIDEIETSMHPVILKELLKLVFSDSHNPKGAQVIFTTHNTVLLSRNLMRRDQIWFTEKARSGDTRLYSLTDFSPRADERRDKRYLAGRYGGLPFIPEGVRP